jgi:DNA polymerase-4
MDAFYASVEQRDDPDLKDKPVCVGGDPQGRGVVTTCSYEARKFGIHSAMPAHTAIRLCPNAIFVRPRFEVYKQVSDQIMNIFHEFTDIVQPMSLDEAYLDISTLSHDFKTSEQIARQILDKILERTGITASVGVSFNKFLAKVASDFNKPNGITVVTYEYADEFIDNLPIGKFYGVGKVTEKKMKELGIFNGADLKDFGLEDLKEFFGKAGEYFYNCAVGKDSRPVRIHWTRKSLGHERTLREDTADIKEMLEILENLALRIEEYLKSHELKGRTITLKMRYSNYQRVTRSITLDEHLDETRVIMENIKILLSKTQAGEKKVRLLGIAISNFQREDEDIKFKQSVLNI